MIRDAKTKWAQKQAANYTPPDEKLSQYCVKRYYERVKFKYVLAFLQWRGKSANANLDDLEEIFSSRVQILQDAVKNGKFKEHKSKPKKEVKQHKSQISVKTSDDEDFELNQQKFDFAKIEKQGWEELNLKDRVKSFEELGLPDPELDQKQAINKTL